MSNEELKAAALAATPGPWVFVDDDWSDGDHANITSAERSDSSIIDIAQVNGGGTASDFDEPFRTEQQANTAFIAAANPAVVLALLAELEAKAQCITGLERYVKELEATLIAATDEVADLTRERDEARAKLATPVRLGAGVLMVSAYSANSCDSEWHLCLARDSVVSAILAAGFTVEGDE